MVLCTFAPFIERETRPLRRVAFTGKSNQNPALLTRQGARIIRQVRRNGFNPNVVIRMLTESDNPLAPGGKPLAEAGGDLAEWPGLVFTQCQYMLLRDRLQGTVDGGAQVLGLLTQPVVRQQLRR